MKWIIAILLLSGLGLFGAGAKRGLDGVPVALLGGVAVLIALVMILVRAWVAL